MLEGSSGDRESATFLFLFAWVRVRRPRHLEAAPPRRFDPWYASARELAPEAPESVVRAVARDLKRGAPATRAEIEKQIQNDPDILKPPSHNPIVLSALARGRFRVDPANVLEAARGFGPDQIEARRREADARGDAHGVAFWYAVDVLAERMSLYLGDRASLNDARNATEWALKDLWDGAANELRFREEERASWPRMARFHMRRVAKACQTCRPRCLRRSRRRAARRPPVRSAVRTTGLDPPPSADAPRAGDDAEDDLADAAPPGELS